jgi:uncharacterized protein (DUF952 family)
LSENFLFHVVPASHWSVLPSQTSYQSERFAEDGFIHLCEPRQLEGVLKRYFLNVPNLMLLVLDPSKLSSPIVYESSSGQTGESFPHLYGLLNRDAIVEVRSLS